jgi:hypothetical protein
LACQINSTIFKVKITSEALLMKMIDHLKPESGISFITKFKHI